MLDRRIPRRRGSCRRLSGSIQFPTGITPPFGALAWDNGRKLLWACSRGNDVGTVDLAANTFTYKFSSAGCVDGLAYDASDDTIWSSDDVADSVEHYKVDGTLISSNPVSLGNCGNSGIAVGGTKLYLANDGCSEIYEVEKDFSSSTFFASFPRRLEDLECDNITFSPGKAAIWSIDAFDNILNAWEIPDGACKFGGGGEGPPGDATCYDEVDNDSDGLVDEEDPDCQTPPRCVEDGLELLKETPLEGVASGTVHEVGEPLADATLGLGPTVHDLNCNLVVPVEDAVDGFIP